MITLFDSRSSSAVSSALIGVASPAGCPSPAAAATAPPPVPKPPAMTLMKLRFIARHMMYDRIAPDDPTKAPTTMSRSLLSMKPVAAAAQPE